MSRAFKSFEAKKSSHKRPISNVIRFLYKLQKKIHISIINAKFWMLNEVLPQIVNKMTW